MKKLLAMMMILLVASCGAVQDVQPPQVIVSTYDYKAIQETPVIINIQKPVQIDQRTAAPPFQRTVKHPVNGTPFQR